MLLRATKELGWFLIELVAIVVAITVIPALMLTLTASSAGLSIGALMTLQGNELGRRLIFASSLGLVATLALGWIIDRCYSFLR